MTEEARRGAPGPAAAGPTIALADRARRLAAGFSDVDQVFRAFAARIHAPGLAYGVVVDGALAHVGAVGAADVGAARAATPRTIFRIASMTKSVTALCCLALRDQGRLALDDPVAEHLPEVSGVRPPTSDSPAITIRHLLTMSAGLVTDDPWGDRQLAMPADDFGAFLAGEVPSNRPPGIAYEYSNLGYALLGRLVGRVAGMPFSAFASEIVLGPLGMTDSFFEVTEVPAQRRAQGYRWEDDGWRPEAPLGDGAFGPMGGLWTSIEDFARYVGFHLDAWPARDDAETGPVRRSTVREMQQGQRLCWPRGEGMPALPAAYGFGLVSTLHPRDGLTVAHSGGLPGFGSRVQWLPHHGVGVMGFANLTYAPVHEAVDQALDALAATGGLQPRPEPPSAALRLAQAWTQRLYRRWDDADALALAAPNLFADRSLERRRQEMAVLRADLGEVLEMEAPIPAGALRGCWRMRCARGTARVTVSLAPTARPLVQLLTVVPEPV
ncbi:MAG TPA: serine hydrolase domain-containing protein [Candidatus Micrarchaeia archaeon]|nr:serine hydrolase domain-containing protein [Candidatus Micrarchaeia archaeon]